MDKRLLSIEEPIEVETSVNVKTKNQSKRLNQKKVKLVVSLVVYLLLIPVAIVLGVMLFNNKKYNIISIVIAILACVPFFVGFEKSKTKVREMVIIAVMTTISVIGRVIFAPIPGFKPVTAIVIITAIACGPQAGFLTGALSAIVSNIFYGQGPWTPFQMLAWGSLGLLAGLIFLKKEKPNLFLLIIVGLIGGVIFSFIMDVWSVFNIDGEWNWARYSALLVSGIPFTIIYAVSNVIFLLLLTNPIIAKLNRLKIKYELFQN